MTEREWLISDEPGMMLAFLRRQSSDRKFRLFGVACCRRIWALLSDGSRQTVLRAEQLAEATPQRADWADARKPATTEAKGARKEPAGTTTLGYYAALGVAHARPRDAAREAAHQASRAMGYAVAEAADPEGRPGQCAWSALYDPAYFGEQRIQAGVLRDIVNPFHPVSADPAWLTPTVNPLARVAYNERLMPSGHLDTARVAILADALEEASCTEQAILDHLRGPGPHVRGCWVVDLLLQKE